MPLELTKRTFGKDAIDHRFRWCIEDEEKVNRIDLKTFRTFNWLLDSKQNEKVEQWQASALLQARSRIIGHMGKAIEDDKMDSNKLELNVASSSKDGAGSKKRVSIETVVESALAKVTKVDGEEKMESEDENRGNSSALCSFFGAKAWSS